MKMILIIIRGILNILLPALGINLFRNNDQDLIPFILLRIAF
jgi:hypothetical protein